MNCVKRLEEQFGGRWVGIKFHTGALPDGRLAERPMRFCEAIAEARTGPLILTPELLNCPGGRRSFGWNHDDEELVRTAVRKTGMNATHAKLIIMSTPHLDEKIAGITVGTDADPDVVVTFAQPQLAMRLINRWQHLRGAGLQAEVSTFMAVCGSVTVRAHLTGDMCLSFGCAESRGYGKIGRDRLVVGMPRKLAEDLLRGLAIHDKNQRLLSRGSEPEQWTSETALHKEEHHVELRV